MLFLVLSPCASSPSPRRSCRPPATPLHRHGSPVGRRGEGGGTSPPVPCSSPAQPAVAREARSSATGPSPPADPLPQLHKRPAPGRQPAAGPPVCPRPPGAGGSPTAGAPGEGCGGSVFPLPSHLSVHRLCPARSEPRHQGHQRLPAQGAASSQAGSAQTPRTRAAAGRFPLPSEGRTPGAAPRPQQPAIPAGAPAPN